jgi:hypothetical protein
LAGQPAQPAQQTGLLDTSAPTLVAENVYPWETKEHPMTGPKGKAYKVKTLAGNEVIVWKGDGGEYWCHGLTLGNSTYSVWGENVEKVLKDAGYGSHAVDKTIKVGDIISWPGYLHTAKVTKVVLKANGDLDPDKTMLDTKNGQRPMASMSLTDLNKEDYGTADKAWRK